jgi:predicted component of type VI protein secretion system|tara:strand:+ start:534 stop:1919 length:1386 start_codon:yes stop_codon:yes gene_type:complete
MNIQFNFGKKNLSNSQESAQTKLRFLITGNFLGSQTKIIEKPFSINIDNFETVLQTTRPTISINGDVLEIDQLDDFHPDHLLRSRSNLSALLDQYRSLKKDGERSPFFATALGAMTNMGSSSTEETYSSETSDNSFDSLLSKNLTDRPSTPRKSGNQNPTVSKIVEEALSGTKRFSDAMSGSVSGALSFIESEMQSGLRTILHDPSFKQIEARWLNLDNLMESFEDGEEAEILFMPLNKAQWEQWNANEFQELKTIVDHQREFGKPINAVFISESMGENEAERESLAALSSISSATACPHFVGGEPALIGLDAFKGTISKSDLPDIVQTPWSSLKQTANPKAFNVVIPKILYRLPYSPSKESIDTFTFVEIEDFNDQSVLPWGDATLTAAKAYLKYFWETESSSRPNATLQLGGVPVLTGPNGQIPATQSWMSEECAAALESAGLLPIISSKNTDRVFLFF